MEKPQRFERIRDRRRRVARHVSELLGTLSERQKSIAHFTASFGKELTSHADLMFRSQIKELVRRAEDMELRHPLTIHLRRREDIDRLPDITRALYGQPRSISELVAEANGYEARLALTFSDVRQAAQRAATLHEPCLFVAEGSTRGVDTYILPTRVPGVTMGISSAGMKLLDSAETGPVDVTFRYLSPSSVEEQ